MPAINTMLTRGASVIEGCFQPLQNDGHDLPVDQESWVLGVVPRQELKHTR